MNVLVTGSEGFIGRHLTAYLKERGYIVSEWDSVDYAPFTSALVPVLPNAAFDAVVHLGALPGVQQSIAEPMTTFQLNTEATADYLEWARQEGISRFIFASSAAAATPLSPYGASKAAGEALCKAYSHTFSMECVPLRFANVYGPGSYDKTSVVASFMRAVVQGQPLTIHGNGQQQRDFVHVLSVCQAIEKALRADASFCDGTPYSVGSGHLWSVEAVAKLMQYVWPETTIQYAQGVPGDIEAPDLPEHVAEEYGFDANLLISTAGVLEEIYFDFKAHFQQSTPNQYVI